MTDAFGLTDVALWSLILGFIAPLVIAFVARPQMVAWVKILIQVVFCLLSAHEFFDNNNNNKNLSK